MLVVIAAEDNPEARVGLLAPGMDGLSHVVIAVGVEVSGGRVGRVEENGARTIASGAGSGDGRGYDPLPVATGDPRSGEAAGESRQQCHDALALVAEVG